MANFLEALHMAEHFIIRSGEKLEHYCQMILKRLDSRLFSSEDFFAIHLSLQEAFANAVKHGNKNDQSKLVHVEFDVSPEKFEIVVADEGPGFKPSEIPNPTENGNLLKTSGRGVLLIRSYMDLVEYNKKGNILRMVKYPSIKPAK